MCDFWPISRYISNISILGHFRYVCYTVVAFGIQQYRFGTVGIGSAFSTLYIIPSEFWYIWVTLVTYFTVGTPVGTLYVLVVVLLVHQSSSFKTHHRSSSFWVRLVQPLRSACTPVAFWYTEDMISVLHTSNNLQWGLVHLAYFGTLYAWYTGW